MRCTLTAEWIKKMCPEYTIEYYLVTKIEIWSFAATWVEMQAIVLCEISLAQNGRFCEFSHRYKLKKFALGVSETAARKDKAGLTEVE